MTAFRSNAKVDTILAVSFVTALAPDQKPTFIVVVPDLLAKDAYDETLKEPNTSRILRRGFLMYWVLVLHQVSLSTKRKGHLRGRVCANNSNLQAMNLEAKMVSPAVERTLHVPRH